MKRGNNRGLSGVVTTLILISLSLVAIVIIWVVIKNIIESGSEKVELGQYTLDMKIQKVLENNNGTNVTIKRNAGQGQLTGVKIIISDGINTYSFDQKNIAFNELETKTFVLNYTGIVKSVSVSPIVKTGNSESAQNTLDTLDFSGYDAVKNLPSLVSWYRFEGNANDEMGRNHGALVGNPQLVDGKYGKAYNFTGYTIDYISLLDNPSLRLETSNMSIYVWFKINNDAFDQIPLFFKGGGQCNSQGSTPGYCFGLHQSGSNFNLKMAYRGFASNTGAYIPTGVLYNLAGTTNVTTNATNINITWNLYLDGKLNKTTSKNNMINEASTGIAPLIMKDDSGSVPSGGAGIIDELMIFNRTLSAQEIQALYNLDLNN